MNGRLTVSIFSAGTERTSLIHKAPIGSAKANTVPADTAPRITLTKIERRTTCSTDRRVPQASSSATMRVTAVLMPEEAKVAAST